MKKLLHALIVALGLTVLSGMILRLSNGSAIVNNLKEISINFLIPGTYIGFVAAGGKIDDISILISDSANVVLYTILIYAAIRFWGICRAKSR